MQSPATRRDESLLKTMADTHLKSPWKLLALAVILCIGLWLLLSGPRSSSSTSSGPSLISASKSQPSLSAAAAGGVDISRARTFSSVIKSGKLQRGVENELFRINDGPGYTTEQWFTFPVVGPQTVIKVYVDGETEPSIEYNLYLGHSVGCNDTEESKLIPWSTSFISHHAGYSSALKNNYRIPFTKSLRITATPPRRFIVKDTDPQSLNFLAYTYWYIVHGILDAPLVVGGYRLPDNARLRLYKQEKKVVQPLEFVNMVDVKGSGWLFQVNSLGG